jgi:hypothetical protein
MSLRPGGQEDMILCDLLQLISFSPLSDRATIVTLILVGKKNMSDLGGGATRYHLIKQGGTWRVERSEQLQAF